MTISGGPSRPTILLADDVAIAADEYKAVKCTVEAFRRALVRVVCSQQHDVFMQAIAYSGGPASDFYDGITKLTEAGIAASSTGHAYLVPVDTLYELQVLVHNSAGSAGTVTVEVTLA